ncbi:hypothetical protein HanIR_Chr16g0821101 [Helianthus annuus]|nr:hypothetical protein HanIR_Chr16g0821101 [Helianthus annuus]
MGWDRNFKSSRFCLWASLATSLASLLLRISALCCWNTLNVSNLHEMSSNCSLYIPLREPELPAEDDAVPDLDF